MDRSTIEAVLVLLNNKIRECTRIGHPAAVSKARMLTEISMEVDALCPRVGYERIPGQPGYVERTTVTQVNVNPPTVTTTTESSEPIETHVFGSVWDALSDDPEEARILKRQSAVAILVHELGRSLGMEKDLTAGDFHHMKIWQQWSRVSGLLDLVNQNKVIDEARTAKALAVLAVELHFPEEASVNALAFHSGLHIHRVKNFFEGRWESWTLQDLVRLVRSIGAVCDWPEGGQLHG